MPQRKPPAHLLELTKRGAKAQLNDLLHELQMLLDLFPHLHDSVDPDDLPVNFLLKRGDRVRDLSGKGAKTATGAKKGSKVEKSSTAKSAAKRR